MKKGYFLILSTAVISGFAIFLNQFGVKVFSPYIFAWLKNLVVAVLLTGVLFALKDWKLLRKINKKQWLLLLAIGLIGGSVPFLLFFKGLSLTSAAQGAFLHKTMFIFVAVLAGTFLKEKIDKRFLFGGIFLILGSLLLLKQIPYSFNIGDLFIVLATILWATESIISKYVLEEIPATIVAWARMFFGALFIFIFLLFTGQLSLVSGLVLPQVGWVLVTSALLFGYVTTWYSGLKHIPVSTAAVILLLGSPITTLLSLIWTGKITFQLAFSGVLMIIGVLSILGIRQAWNSVKHYVRT